MTSSNFISVISTNGFGLESSFANTLAELLKACHAEGYDMRISQGLRTPHRQAEYYCKSKGRTAAQIDAAVKMLRESDAPWLAGILEQYRDIPKGKKWLTNALPGAGWHQWGLAADCYCFENGNLVGDAGHPSYKFYAEKAKKLGLRAGYYFKTQDAGHVQEPAEAQATSIYKWSFIDSVMKARFDDKQASIKM